MRKSTVIVLVIILFAGMALLFALDIATERTKETVAVQQRLTTLYRDRGDLAPDTRVRLLWENQEPGRPGQGLKVEVTPSQAVLQRSGGLRGLLKSIVREAPAAFGRVGDSLRWLRVRVFFPDQSQLDTWLERDLEGAFGDPQPPLPVTWPETPKPPAPPPTPAPAVPAPAPERPR